MLDQTCQQFFWDQKVRSFLSKLIFFWVWFLEKFFATPRSKSNDICNKKLLENERVFFHLSHIFVVLSQKSSHYYGNKYEMILYFVKLLCKIQNTNSQSTKKVKFLPILDSGGCVTWLIFDTCLYTLLIFDNQTTIVKKVYDQIWVS